MLSKVDLQLFMTSLRVVSTELEHLPPEAHVPKRVFEELSCMAFVIERSQAEDQTGKFWSGGVPSPTDSKKR